MSSLPTINKTPMYRQESNFDVSFASLEEDLCVDMVKPSEITYIHNNKINLMSMTHLFQN